MKRKFIYLCLGITIIVVILCRYFYNNKEVLSNDVDVRYAITIDGKTATKFPSQGAYKVDIECQNATCTWLYDKWILSMTNITGDVSCDIKFTSISKIYLNNFVIGLTDTTQGDGKVVSENGYRYEGKNPNNYVWFNNELWRMIGVFDSSSHGISGSNLVKLLRVNSIGDIVWDKSSSNNWKTSSLNSLLNGAYYKAQNGTDSGYCYMYSNSVSTNCDFTAIGIQTYYRNMIKNVTWYLGGRDGGNSASGSLTTDDIYALERGTKVYSGRPTSSTGYIGLMYPSDYGYAVLSSKCSRSKSLGVFDYGQSNCAYYNWIYSGYDEFFIMPIYSNSNMVVTLLYDGSVEPLQTYVYNPYSVRPTLYLDSSVYVIDGDGSITNPYIIGI